MQRQSLHNVCLNFRGEQSDEDLDDFDQTDFEVLEDGTIQTARARYIQVNENDVPLPEEVWTTHMPMLVSMLVQNMNRMANNQTRRIRLEEKQS